MKPLISGCLSKAETVIMSHLHPILRRHIAFHIVFRGILLRPLSEDKGLQHLDALIHRGDDSLHPLLVDEFLRASEHLSDVLVNVVQLGKVEPVKRGHQPKLILVGSLERLAGDIPPGTDLRRQLVVPQAGTAVVNGRWPKPFQSVRVAEQPKIVEVPVLVGDEVVQRHHLVQGMLHIRDAQGFATVAVVLVNNDKSYRSSQWSPQYGQNPDLQRTGSCASGCESWGRCLWFAVIHEYLCCKEFEHKIPLSDLNNNMRLLKLGWGVLFDSLAIFQRL